MEVVNGDTIWVGKVKAAATTPYALTVRAEGFPVGQSHQRGPAIPVVLEPIKIDKAECEIVALNDKLNGLRIPVALTIATYLCPKTLISRSTSDTKPPCTNCCPMASDSSITTTMKIPVLSPMGARSHC